jgi:UPF0755 protein
MANEPSWDEIFTPRPADPAADAAAAPAFPLGDPSAVAPAFQEPASPAPTYQVPTYEEPTYQAPTYQAPTYQVSPPPAYDPVDYPAAAPDYFETAAPAPFPVAPAASPSPAWQEPAASWPTDAAGAWPLAEPAPVAPEPTWPAAAAEPPAPAQPAWTPEPTVAAPVWIPEPEPAAAPPAWTPEPASDSVWPAANTSWSMTPDPAEPAWSDPAFAAATPAAASVEPASPVWNPEPAAWPAAAEAAPVWAPEPTMPNPAAPAWTPEPAAEVSMPEVSWNTAVEPPVAARSLPEWPAEPVTMAPPMAASIDAPPTYPATATYPIAEAPAPAAEPDGLSAFDDLFAAPAPEAQSPVAASPTAAPEQAPASDAWMTALAPAAAAPVAATPVVAAAGTPSPGTASGFSPEDPFSGLFGNAMGTPASAAPRANPLDGDGNGFSGGDGGNDGGRGGRGRGRGGDGFGPAPRKRSLKWLAITLPIVIVLGLGAGGAAFAWLNYEDQVRELLGWELPNDFEGTGNGEEAIVTIQAGDIGSDVANTLHDAGVTMTFDAFYDLLLEQPENVNFIPGNYSLQKQMSAQSALDALMNPENKITSRLLITEGTVLPSALAIISETTGIPLEDVQAAAADPTVYGVPANAPSLEGYLFPATYELDGTETAEGILQLLVDEMFARLDALGVAPENRHEVLTKAGLVQREAGPNEDDFYKIARVFQNRIDQGMNLQSDATVAYGTGNLQTVWTTDAERADASNPYNTYANPGLPVGPIGAPGEVAIRAVLAPADGPWLFFVPINLATGETVFSETADQHEAAVEQLRAWCNASDENASYCE